MSNTDERELTRGVMESITYMTGYPPRPRTPFLRSATAAVLGYTGLVLIGFGLLSTAAKAFP